MTVAQYNFYLRRASTFEARKNNKVLYFFPRKGWFLYQNVCKRIEGYSLYMLRDRKQVIRMSGFTPLRIQREIVCRASVTSYDNYISGEINYQQTR